MYLRYYYHAYNPQLLRYIVLFGVLYSKNASTDALKYHIDDYLSFFLITAI